MSAKRPLPGPPAAPPPSPGAPRADPQARERLTRAIESQQEHFDMFGLQLGFAYEGGAVVPDGSAAREAANPVRNYLPTTRPGARTPHAWVERGGERTSILDLLPYDRFILIAGHDGDAWVRAAHEVPIPIVGTLVAERDFTDREGAWAA